MYKHEFDILFQKVYLTADSENLLTSLDSNCAYIIGVYTLKNIHSILISYER